MNTSCTPGAWNSRGSGTFLTPPRVRSLERMEGRRPGVRCGAGRCPIRPRAPERRARGAPGALGSPAAFPSDMLPGREEMDNNVNCGDRHAGPWLLDPQSVRLSLGSQLLPAHMATPRTTAATAIVALSPQASRGRDAHQRTPTPYRVGRDFSSGAARSRP